MANDAAEILEAINDRAITRLAVVDGPARRSHTTGRSRPPRWTAS